MERMLKRRRPMTGAAVAVALGLSAVLVVVLVLVTGVHHDGPTLSPGGSAPSAPGRPIGWDAVVPAPASVTPANATFRLADGAPIVASSDPAVRVATYLASFLGHGTAVRRGTVTPRGGIAIQLDPAAPAGDEAYQLDITADGVALRARAAAGLFWGAQTLRQLTPADPAQPIVLPGGRVVDRPRFAYRGVMLDVARHFFSVADVERLIDLSTMYKVNYLHLHLTDDQGWRIAITNWPRLTTVGGSTEVGGGEGGYYTQADYRRIVQYAADRFVTVVPEVDVPGHTNAALASYRELNCDGRAPQPYTGIDVGFSALCADDPDTDRFLNDVLGQLAALTPGPYLHVGGDEAARMTPAAYATVMARAQAVVGAHGKTVIGWHQMAGTTLSRSAVLQFWDPTSNSPAVTSAVAAGHKVIMSPANHAYLDQKYDPGTRIGLTWAGPTSVQEAYAWDPAKLLPRVGEESILGVEGALWTETVTTVADIEYLAFPRLVALAEIGWSPGSTHHWTEFRVRLGAQAPRWDALGVHFARTDDVPWASSR
jgi:hexosaminidase